MSSRCPACDFGESIQLPEPFGPKEHSIFYRRCLHCGSIFSPELLAAKLSADEWDALPRPVPKDGDAARLLRPFHGEAAMAIAGRTDPALLLAFRNRRHTVYACDPSGRAAAEAARLSLPSACGRPATGALAGKHDFILVEGLLEYSDDPLGELRAVREALHPDGRARLEIVAAEGSLTTQFGPRFSLYAPPAVRTLFTWDGATMLAVRAGFRQLSSVRRPGRAFDWLARRQPFDSAWSRRLSAALDLFLRTPSIHVITARPD